MMNPKLLILLAALLALNLVGCASQPAGSLLIIGGGLRDDNAAVYQRFVQLAGPNATIGVIPTASGVDDPGAETISIIKGFAHPGQRVVLIPLFKDDAAPSDAPHAKAADPAIVDQIRACRALWFTGGDQSRITAVFRPLPARTSPAYLATLAVLERGGVIAGTSAGAAIMSDPMITGGTSEDALKHGSTNTPDPANGQGVGLALGMGYLTPLPGEKTPPIVDQHFTQRNRFGRLWTAMLATGAPRGLGIPEDTALEVHRPTGTLRAIGPNPVVDMRSAR